MGDLPSNNAYNVTVECGDALTIGNAAVAREFSMDDGRLSTARIVNRRAGTAFVPSASSVEFAVMATRTATEHADGVEGPVAGERRGFSSDDLILAGAPSVRDVVCPAGDVRALLRSGGSGQSAVPSHPDGGRHGKEVVFPFLPYRFRGVDYTIREHVIMADGDHYMRKFLEIAVPYGQRDAASIDRVDLESLAVTPGTDTTWTVPDNAGGLVGTDQYMSNLGQPIYIDGMFFGAEFPQTDTQIVDHLGRIRYYSGKTFARLLADGQAHLSDDRQTIVYATWPTVLGAARSRDNAVIRADFLRYIADIATPTRFRIQYNSWLDNMMTIDDRNILASFQAVADHLRKAGERPLDSYVVDDGWNNYNDTDVSVDEACSGTGRNTSGFWSFNSKFPQGFGPASALASRLASHFGAWIGPRGGYDFYGNLANILTASGKGSCAGGSVDVADRTYAAQFSDMVRRWQHDYRINYWKWDGFADEEQYAAFPAADGVPGYANRHMTGGFHHMYHVTDLWEAWIGVMREARADAADLGIDLWISLTCYLNPSPWLLQWANSVWLQCGYDQADAGASPSKMDRQLTYRDAAYYDFIRRHEFQFPLEHLYNHDPIYGKHGTGITADTADEAQFRNYLITQASRGTAFWELYLSASLMSEAKWRILAEALRWAEDNHHILRHAVMFGGSPNRAIRLDSRTNGEDLGSPYGFSAFDGTDGLVMMRNPSTRPADIAYRFDAGNGAPADPGAYRVSVEHAYNPTDPAETKDTPSDPRVADAQGFVYGRTYTFTLQPDESVTLRVRR